MTREVYPGVLVNVTDGPSDSMHSMVDGDNAAWFEVGDAFNHSVWTYVGIVVATCRNLYRLDQNYRRTYVVTNGGVGWLLSSPNEVDTVPQ